MKSWEEVSTLAPSQPFFFPYDFTITQLVAQVQWQEDFG
jgi:hypothetical protein